MLFIDRKYLTPAMVQRYRHCL